MKATTATTTTQTAKKANTTANNTNTKKVLPAVKRVELPDLFMELFDKDNHFEALRKIASMQMREEQVAHVSKIPGLFPRLLQLCIAHTRPEVSYLALSLLLSFSCEERNKLKIITAGECFRPLSLLCLE